MSRRRFSTGRWTGSFGFEREGAHSKARLNSVAGLGIVHLIMWARDLISNLIDATERRGVAMKRSKLAASRGGRALTNLVLWPSDYLKSHQYYKAQFGQGPRVFFPRTFNEKIQHTKLFKREPLHQVYADKLAVRDYISERVGAELLPTLYWTGTDLLEARAIELPKRFVVKANHSWETVILCQDRDTFDWDASAAEAAGWLEQDHAARAGEWQYRWIQPRLLIEEFLDGEGDEPPPDYKFFCFHGKPEFLAVDEGRFGDPKSSYFDMEFKQLPFTYGYGLIEGDVKPPESLNEMIRLAEILSRDEPFLRVDFYEVKGAPVCGELVTCPDSGFEPFDPPEWDATYGAMM